MLWPAFLPSNVIALCLIGSGVFFWIGWRRTGSTLILLGGGSLCAVALFPLSALLFEPLEARFTANQLPDQVDGIIVLGGAVNPWITKEWGQPSLSAGAERMTECVALAKRYPLAKLVFTGGHWGKSEDQLSEANVASAFLKQQGIPESRLILEDRATSTYQNAVYSHALVEPKEGEIWVLVTSAAHMPRAVGAFRHAGWSIVAYPVDFRTTGWKGITWPPAVGQSLHDFDYVVREWMSLAAYWLLDQSGELLPGPRAP